jgi:hypothetical protein
MTDNDIQILRERDGKPVRLHMTDGEIVTAKVLFVSETENDVIVHLISSTRVERYEKSDVQPAFQYLLADIAWVEPLQEASSPAQ